MKKVKRTLRLQIFSSTTLHVAPGDGFLGTQRTVIWICHSINLHVTLSLVCDCMLFVIYIPNINLITMNNMSFLYIFHVAISFSHFFLSFRYFLYKPDCNNQNCNVWSPYWDIASSTYVVSTLFQKILFCCTDHN